MPKHRVPKGRVLRKVWLDHAALSWALSTVKDDEANVILRLAMTEEWQAKYNATIQHIVELIRRAEES